MNSEFKFRLLRNATGLISWDGLSILVDPMLGDKGTMDPMPWTSNGIRNPTVPLPVNKCELERVLNKVDLVLLTHLHSDHWDAEAVRLIRKTTLIICQTEDKDVLFQQGFTKVRSIDQEIHIGDTRIIRTKAIHGTGEIGSMMGIASGYILEKKNKRLFLTGDTIWCNQIQDLIDVHKPHCIIANCGGAQFDRGEPIIMDLPQLEMLCSFYTGRLICVHLEALNHCKTSRKELVDFFGRSEYSGNWKVPEDGEELVMF
jgi:L-ascorbate metabolism protein UlaG (beta-lactamase superfamily)